jgi:hypothetical protein
MQIRLRISPSAAEFINKTFEGQSREKVLVVTGYVVGSLRTMDGDAWDKRPLQDMIEEGRQLIDSLPAKMMVEYYISTQDIGRLPQEDIHVVDGIKCYLPDRIIRLIGSREIVLDDGKLRFEPGLEPVEMERKPSRGG